MPADCETRPAATKPYVAVRWPANHVVFHLVDEGVSTYAEIQERVLTSVREALEAMGVHVVETTEEAI